MIYRRHSLLLTVPVVLQLISAPVIAAQDGQSANPVEGAGAPSSARQPDDPLGFLQAAREVGHGRPATIVAAAVRRAHLCATVDFSHVSVDAKRGFFEHEKEHPHLLYAGDPLRPFDVDLREAGVEVQIDFGTPRSRDDSASAYLFLPRGLRRHRGVIYGLEHVAQALTHSAAPCADGGSSEDDA